MHLVHEELNIKSCIFSIVTSGLLANESCGLLRLSFRVCKTGTSKKETWMQYEFSWPFSAVEKIEALGIGKLFPAVSDDDSHDKDHTFEYTYY